MPTPLYNRIRSAAINTPALTALLGTNPFRFYARQLPQPTSDPASKFPAVVMQQIGGGKAYTVNARVAQNNTRMQFCIWGVNTGAGFDSIAAVETALASFLDTLNLTGIPGLVQYPNLIVAGRDGFYAQTQPGNPQRLVDAMIFANDTL